MSVGVTMFTQTIPFKWAVLSFALLLAVAVAPYIQNRFLESQIEEQQALEQRYQRMVAEYHRLHRERHLQRQWETRESQLVTALFEKPREISVNPQLAGTINAETSRELVNNLSGWRMISGGRLSSQWSDCYDYAQNPRVIRLLYDYREDPVAIVPFLRTRFLDLQREVSNRIAAATSDWSKMVDSRIAATAVLYLLTEFGDIDSLPLFRDAITQHMGSQPDRDRSIVPHTVTVYAMHELCKVFPRERLTETQQESLDEVLQMGASLEPPIEIKVVGWDVLTPSEATPRGHFESEAAEQVQRTMIVREWPLSFKEPTIDESAGWPRLAFEMARFRYSPSFMVPRAKELSERIDAFVRESYPPSL